MFLKQKCASHFYEETTNKNKLFLELKHKYLIHTDTNKAFKGTILNQV